MATERQIALARENLTALCNTLEKDGIKYNKDEQKLTVHTAVKGKNTDILVAISFSPEVGVLSFMCPVNLAVPENYRGQFAIAVSRINFAMLEGGYDFNPQSGAVMYRLSTCYEESVLNEDAFRYLLFTAFKHSDEYHPALKTVVDRQMTADQIINFIA